MELPISPQAGTYPWIHIRDQGALSQGGECVAHQQGLETQNPPVEESAAGQEPDLANSTTCKGPDLCLMSKRIHLAPMHTIDQKAKI